MNRQGPAQLTRRDGCDSSFDNRNGAMCSGPRVGGWTGCLPSGARANLPTVLSGFWGFSTYQLFPFSGRSPWITSPPHSTCCLQQQSLHTRGRATAPQRCTQHRATPATNQQRATGLAPSTNRRQRMLPCKPTRRESRAAVLSICPNTASTSVQILRARVTALPRVGCTATALGAGRTATVHHLGADDLVSRFPVI